MKDPLKIAAALEYARYICDVGGEPKDVEFARCYLAQHAELVLLRESVRLSHATMQGEVIEKLRTEITTLRAIVEATERCIAYADGVDIRSRSILLPLHPTEIELREALAAWRSQTGGGS